jgi:hypothetical protein
MKWIVDTTMNDYEKLVESLNRFNINYQLFKYKPFMNYKDILEEIKYEMDEKVICYGTINFIEKIQKCIELYPGSYCNFEGFKCSSYYPVLKDLLLNDKYEIIYWKDVLNKLKNLDTVFIRPDSGKKEFTGCITNYDSLKHDVGFSVSSLDPLLKVIIAPYVEIDKEWRFFVSNWNIITGCLYRIGSKHYEEYTYDKEAYTLALRATTLYNPDPIFVIDICKTKTGEYKVLELNSFSCSGLYTCNTNNIVQFVENL